MEPKRHSRENREPSFSFYEFKGWLAKQPEEDFSLPEFGVIQANKIMGDIVGKSVESRLGLQRLENQIAEHNADMDQGQVERLAKQFKQQGGVVVEVCDLRLGIDTSLGHFNLPKLYTKLSS